MELSSVRWTPVAMVRITVWLLLGVCTALLVTDAVAVSNGLTKNQKQLCHGLWLTMTTATVLLGKKRSAVWGLFRLFAVALTGFILLWSGDDRLRPNHLANIPYQPKALLTEVQNPPVKVVSGYRVTVGADAALFEQGWQVVSGRIALYTTDSALMPGDRIIILGLPESFRKNPNPGGFDVARMMARNDIYLKIRASASGLIRLPDSGKRPTKLALLRWAAVLRNACISRLKLLTENSRHHAITSALVLGITTGLDPEVSQPFAVTGTLHVLAVSGMHVGIIYGIILLILSPLGFWSGNRWVVAVISLILLWLYALITGLTPSVLRAVVMFSLVTAARPFGIRTNIWNVLASSVFLLILSDPYLITKTGFLLSYLAVAGIVWIGPMLAQKWEPENIIAQWTWKTLCITTAAQILTLPITMTFFGKLPAYFLPANLLIIPLSTAALGISIAGLALSGVPLISELVRYVLKFTLDIMTRCAEFFGDLPGSVIEVPEPGFLQAILWLGILTGFILFVQYRTAAAWIASILLATICSMADWMQRTEDNVSLTVYRWTGRTAIGIRNNRNVTVIATRDPAQALNDVPAIIRTDVFRQRTDTYRYIPDTTAVICFGTGQYEWWYVNGNVRTELKGKEIIVGPRGINSLKKLTAEKIILIGRQQDSFVDTPASLVHDVGRDGAYISGRQP